MRVLVTGATGFVGMETIARVAAQGRYEVRAAVRRDAGLFPAGVEVVRVLNLSSETEWGEALRDVDAVVHAAARVHVMRDDTTDPLSEFRQVNVAGTLNLARQAAGAGVRRFVFISSIKVNGEQTKPGCPFRADDRPDPRDAYGISKHEAEQGLQTVSRQTGLEVVVIRPVLVYGPGVKANFRSMMRWISREVPLPLGAIHNARSLVAIDNLADLIITCLHHPAAAGQIFLVSDGEDVSTPELLRRIGRAMGRRPRLIPIPARVLRLAATLVGRADVAQRLCGSLQVDIEKTRVLLSWVPPVSLSESLARTVRHWSEHA
jgi:nucleoside-diphosphate-sugar epimerase